MYCKLEDSYALRSWRFTNRALYHRTSAAPLLVDKETFDLLLLCDGERDLEETDALRSLVQRGVVSPCARGERVGAWSRYRRYDHRLVYAMNLMLTGKCNYNCLHCFNAADNAPLMTEWAWDDLLDLLDQAADCGIHAITLTGGEPMLHPRFLDVVREIHKRDMVLEKLATNGHFITQETLGFFRDIGCNPWIKISFDGVGHHDWLRNHVGAEQDALRALRLCASNGFRATAQTQVFRKNLDSLYETLCTLEDAGVASTRLIRTNETPRWQQNDAHGSLSGEEYFEHVLDLACRYLHDEHAMDVVMWRFLALYPQDGTYDMVPVLHPDGVYRPTAPVCMGNRTMMAVTSDGDVIPCLQMGGYLAKHGIRFDNLKERRLADVLQGGPWLDAVCMNHFHLREGCPDCDQCAWFGVCGGCCRALGLLYTGETTSQPDYCGRDPLACLFFKGGWYDKVRAWLADVRPHENRRIDACPEVEHAIHRTSAE